MPIVRDRRVVTWASKIEQIDKSSQAALTVGESAYFWVCLTPNTRWLILSLLMFQDLYKNRWVNFTGIREIDQLIAEAMEALICPMACQEDIQDINSTLQAISLTLIEMRDRLGGVSGDLDARLTEIKTEVADLDTSLSALGLPDLIDKIEPMLNGVGVILGAPDIPLNGGP